MLALVSGLFSKTAGWIIGAALFVALCFLGHHLIYENGYQDGEQKVQAAWDADKAKQTAVALAAVSQAASDSQGNAQVAVAAAVKQDTEQQGVKTVFNQLDNQVKDYAKSHATAASGQVTGAGPAVTRGLDADGLRIWNAANAGASSGDSSAHGINPQQPASQVP